MKLKAAFLLPLALVAAGAFVRPAFAESTPNGVSVHPELLSQSASLMNRPPAQSGSPSLKLRKAP